MKKQQNVLQNRLTGADGVRALACLLVIAHHISQRLNMMTQTKGVQEAQAFFLMGNAGVSIFFVLSGFLLSYPFWKRYVENDDFPSMKQYTVRRAARIIPGYYIAILVSILVIWLGHIPVERLGTRLLAGFTFTAGFSYVTFFPVDTNAALWSISFEVFSYLLMPLFMFGLYKLPGRSRSFWRAMAYWAGALILVYYANQLVHQLFTPDNIRRGWQYGNIGGAKYWMPNYNPLGFFGHFSMGILAAGITAGLFKIQEKLKALKKFGVFDLIASMSLAGAFYILWEFRRALEFSHSLQNQPYFFPSFAALVAVALAAAPHSVLVGRILDNPFFRFTSRVSFGLYVWHYFIIFLVSDLWAKDYVYMGTSSLGRWGWISLAIVAVSYIIATLSYYLVEKPILDKAHKISG
ncbi:MAG: acyltransferase, partial [Bacillota bacterium]|nr:acyltransferase [Bacillota bacterium]